MRLAFAVVAHLDPDIMLVDEVLAVGDASFQKKCIGKMEDVAKDGRTVLFISHNMIAINSICKRVIWINNGKIVEDGPTAQVVANYFASSSEGQLLEECWDDAARAPGNDMVRLHRILIQPQDNNQPNQLTMQSPFIVIVEYWNLVDNANLHITLHLQTAEGVVAFTTGSQSIQSMSKGLFRSVCYFPGNLLNSGQHRFIILVVKDTSSVIYQHESRVSFEILDMREREGSWYGKEPGVVQPILKWETEYIGNDVEKSIPMGKYS